MRARAARVLVQSVSWWINAAYSANCDKRWKRERLYGRIGREVQRVTFPIARRLDRQAMVEQMVEECWWG